MSRSLVNWQTLPNSLCSGATVRLQDVESVLISVLSRYVAIVLRGIQEQFDEVLKLSFFLKISA